MPEITEETLQAWAQLADYTDSHGSLDARVALDAAIAEIRRLRGEIAERDGQVGALVDVVTRYHEALPSPESTTILANLSKAAAAHEKRLRAEGAAEAWRSLARNIRADSVFAKSARNPEFLDAFADEEIAEAARLREEAER